MAGGRQGPVAGADIEFVILICVVLAAGAGTLGCGVTGGSPVSPPPPPPPPISVSVSPPTTSVFLGAPQQFAASVTNTTNPGVNWSVNGVPGGDSVVGTISNAGLYTAPQIMPSPATLTVAATSVADPSKSASATVTVMSDISITVSPGTAPVELGSLRQFAASVTSSGNPNRAVSWSVSGSGCSGAACGTVDSSGLFTAPQILPSPPSVTLTARSVADPSKAASAAITVTSNFALTVSGPASVNTGATVAYTATITPAPNSNPSRVVNWSVSGPGCSGAACGSITGTGNYTAPASAPSPAAVNITATPEADPSKAASLAVTINSTVTVTVAPVSANVALGQSQPFAAMVTGTQDTSVTWDVNGVVGGNSTVGTVTNSPSDPDHTTYTAPASLPTPNQVTVRARSNASPSVFGTATVTLTSAIAVQVAPSSSIRAINHTQTFTVQVANSSNQTVQWAVNGIPGGDATLGQICVASSSPCQPIATSSAGTVDYLAPSSVPSSNPVTVSATSQADPSKSGSGQVTILAHVQVSVLPSSVTLAPGTTHPFTAQVDGTANQNVTWQVSGVGCSGPGGPCGAIDSLGLYTAPLAPPSPDSINVTATSADDTSRSASATVTIATGPSVNTLLPASVTAGAAGGFPLKVQGSGFLASSPGPGSTIILNGSARTTTCASTGECITTLAAADLAVAGSFPLQIRNPDATLSNQVAFVVVQLATTEDVIALTAAAPSATGKDIVVVEPSTAGGTSPDLNLNVAAMGPFSPANNSCVLAGSPLVLNRPSSGNATADVCAFSLSGLDPALTYTLTGPAPNDVSIISKEPLGLGIIHLALQLSSTSQVGPRSLFVENPNKDKAAASGALEVK